jgi:uncharacterized membrane protein
MSSEAVIDKIKAEFAGTTMELVHTNLGTEEEQHLREMFADED